MSPDNQPAYNESPKKRDSGNTTKYLLIGGGALLALTVLGDRRGYVPYSRKPKDYDLLEKALEDREYKDLLGKDNSPVILYGKDSTKTDEYLFEKITGAYSYFEGRLQTLTQSLLLPESSLTDAIYLQVVSSLLDNKTKDLTKAKFDLYLQLLDVWCQIYATVAPSAMTAVAQITEAIGAEMNNATTCVRTAYVKHTTDKAEFAEYTTAKSEISNGGVSFLFGLVGGGRSRDNMITSSGSTSTQSREVVYVPHCESYQMDPAKVSAILATQTLSLQIPITVLSGVIAQLPDLGKILSL